MSGTMVDDDYIRRLAQEQKTYAEDVDVHGLPDIYHYWSNEFLKPVFEAFGFVTPEDFFVRALERHCKGKSGPVRIISIGSGNCDAELNLAKRLVESGQTQFAFDCLDINPDMLQRGRDSAQEIGMSDRVKFVEGDFNAFAPRQRYDVVIANQSLHHVTKLEPLFDEIHDCLEDDGVFLTSDMIGRNGHQRWPEALDALKPLWEELPSQYRYNRVLKRQEDQFLDHNCSSEGFEGIRSQDILRLLDDRFSFELFIPFANIIMVFIDRQFGHNFDLSSEKDRAFIDRVHERDLRGLLSGELKPTQMIAALRKHECQTLLVHPRLTPEFCIRTPDRPS